MRGGRQEGVWATARRAKARADATMRRAQRAVFDDEAFTPGTSLLVRSRVPIMLLGRMAGRSSLLMSALKEPDQRRRHRFIVALSLGITMDVAEAYALRHTPRTLGKERAARDAVELVVYASALENYSGMGMSAAPLLAECGYRFGLNGIASVAAVQLTSVIAARRLAHRRLDLDRLYWLLPAALGGLAVRRVEQRRTVEHVTMRDAVIGARAEQAALAGRRRVALEWIPELASFGDCAHDVFTNGAQAIDTSSLDPSSPLSVLVGGRRAALWPGASVDLGTLVQRWAFDYRREILKASDQVPDIDIDEPTRAVLVTSEQERRLVDALTALRPRRRLRVRTRTQRTYRHGAPIRLDIESDDTTKTLWLAAEAVHKFGVADPTAAVALLGSLWAVGQSTRAADSIELRATLPGSAAFLASAALIEAGLRRRGSAFYGPTVALTLGAAAVQSTVVQRSIAGRPLAPDGSPRLPIQNALLAPAILVGFCWSSMSRGVRGGSVAGLVVLATAGTAALAPPRPWAELAAGCLGLPVIGALAAAAYRDHIERDALRESEAFDRAVTEQVQGFVVTGEADEWDLLEQAAEQALNTLDQGCDPDLLARWREGFTRLARYAQSRRRALVRVA